MYGLCYGAIQRQLALALSLFLEIYSLLTNRQRVLPGTNDIGSVHGYETKNIFPLSSVLIIDGMDYGVRFVKNKINVLLWVWSFLATNR